MTRGHQPNHYLGAILREAGLSGHDLAQAVNRAGAESGLPLHYDRTSVAHWLAGSRPVDPGPVLLSEGLSRRLRRTVTPQDLHLAREAESRPPQDGSLPTAVDLLARLGTGASRRRGSVLVYTLTGPLPEFPDSARTSRGSTRHVPGSEQGTTVPGRLGTHHVRALEHLLTALDAQDAAMGGRLPGLALTGFLGTVAPVWLRAPAAPRVHGQLLVVIARLSYLAGFTCFDGQSHGRAQAYYRTAAELAAEAADPQAHAVALRGMSVQAYYLGHHHHAQDLADASARLSGGLPPREAAFIAGQQAVAAAGNGDGRGARAHLARTSRLLDRAATPPAGSSCYGWAAYSHQEAEVLAATGDVPGAVSALARSIGHRPPTERRAKAVTTARMAQLLLSEGHLDRACAAWQSVLDDYPLLDSGRVDTAVSAIRSQLTRHASVPVARAVLTRAGALGIPMPRQRI